LRVRTTAGVELHPAGLSPTNKSPFSATVSR
jgi:hypothetical protein